MHNDNKMEYTLFGEYSDDDINVIITKLKYIFGDYYDIQYYEYDNNDYTNYYHKKYESLGFVIILKNVFRIVQFFTT